MFGVWLLAVGLWLFGFWLLAVGVCILAVGCWLLAFGCWLVGFGCWLSASGFWCASAAHTTCNLDDWRSGRTPVHVIDHVAVQAQAAFVAPPPHTRPPPKPETTPLPAVPPQPSQVTINITQVKCSGASQPAVTERTTAIISSNVSNFGSRATSLLYSLLDSVCGNGCIHSLWLG